MIGDADLNIDRDQNSTPWLEEVVYRGGHPSRLSVAFLRARTCQVSDDHLPFMQARRSLRRSDRFRLRLQQRLLAHAAGHSRQTQPQEPGDCRQHDPGNGAHPRQNGPAAAEVNCSQVSL